MQKFSCVQTHCKNEGKGYGMKKWITAALLVLLALMLVSGAQGEGRDAFLGCWELDSLERDGQYISRRALSFTVYVSIREDDTMAFNLNNEQFTICDVRYEQVDGEWVCRADMAISEMYINEEGQLVFTLDSGMKTWMNHAESDPDGVAGLWTIDHAYRDGTYQSRSELRDITLLVGPDQYGVLTVNDKTIDVKLYLQDGKPVLLQRDGSVFPSTLSGDGQLLTFDLETTQGTAWSLALRRDAAAVPGQTPAVEATPVQTADNPFEGTWTTIRSSVNGHEVALSAVGLTQVKLVFSGDQVTLVVDDSPSTYPVEYITGADGRVNGCVLVDDSEKVDVDCAFDAQGHLLMNMYGDDGVVVFEMTKEAQAPAAQSAPATSSPFAGTWSALHATIGGREVSLASAGLTQVKLIFSGDQVTLVVDDSRVTYPLEFTRDGSGSVTGCTFKDRNATSQVYVDCCFDAQGRLLMNMHGDSGVITLVMECEEAPVQTPAEEPAQEAPQGYDGEWTLTHVVINGRMTPAESAGLNGTLRISGETARYIVGAENALGVVTITDGGLTLTSRTAEHVFTVNEAGQLCQQAESFGMTVTLCFTRQP